MVRVAHDVLREVLASAEATMASGSLRYRWRMIADGAELVSGDGVADLTHARTSMKSRFTMPVADGPDQTAENYSIIEGGVLHTMQPMADPEPDRWIAVEMGFGGLAATPVGFLLWLRGATSPVEVGCSAPPPAVRQFRAELDLDLAVRRTPEPEREEVRTSLESGRVGLSHATVPAELAVDGAGRVCWLRCTVPPGASPLFPVAFGGDDRVELALSGFGSSAVVPVPGSGYRLTVAEFLASIDIGPDAAEPGTALPSWGR
jgi:hypothetical protein